MLSSKAKGEEGYEKRGEAEKGGGVGEKEGGEERKGIEKKEREGEGMRGTKGQKGAKDREDKGGERESRKGRDGEEKEEKKKVKKDGKEEGGGVGGKPMCPVSVSRPCPCRTELAARQSAFLLARVRPQPVPVAWLPQLPADSGIEKRRDFEMSNQRQSRRKKSEWERFQGQD